jgi:hypothetical protein
MRRKRVKCVIEGWIGWWSYKTGGHRPVSSVGVKPPLAKMLGKVVSIMNRIAFTILLASQLTLGARAQEADEFSYQGDFDQSNVFVLVETISGLMGQRITAGLAADGHLRIVGAYKDTTTVRANVFPDTALVYINDLLAMAFLGQPEFFRAECSEAVMAKNGRISLLRTTSIDAGSIRITLHIGSLSHSVLLALPAYGAPQALTNWVQKYRALVNKHADWKLL